MKKSIKITLSTVAVGAIVVGGSALVQKDNNDTNADSDHKSVVHANSKSDDVVQTETQTEPETAPVPDKDYDVIKTNTTIVYLEKEPMPAAHEEAQKMIDEDVEKNNTKNLKEKYDEEERSGLDGNDSIAGAHDVIETFDAIRTGDEDRIPNQDQYHRMLEYVIRGLDLIEYEGPENTDIQRVLTLASELYNQDTIAEDDERYEEMHEILHELDEQFNGENSFVKNDPLSN